MREWWDLAMRGTERWSSRGGKRAYESRYGWASLAYRPPPPPVDPNGWWDPALTRAEVEARIAGLERGLEAARRGRAPKEWLREEGRVLRGLQRRHREGRE